MGREALISVACELMKTLPPKSVTQAMVAERAGVNRSLVRYYFKDQPSLMAAAAERLSQEFRAKVQRSAARTDSTPKSRLRARIDAMVENEDAYPLIHRLLMEEVMTSKSRLAKSFYTDELNTAAAAYGAILDEGVARGDFRPGVNPMRVLVSIMALTHFYPIGHKLLGLAGGQRAMSKADYKAFVTETVLQLIGAPDVSEKNQ